MTDPVDDVLRRLSNIILLILALIWLASLGFLVWNNL